MLTEAACDFRFPYSAARDVLWREPEDQKNVGLDFCEGSIADAVLIELTVGKIPK